MRNELARSVDKIGLSRGVIATYANMSSSANMAINVSDEDVVYINSGGGTSGSAPTTSSGTATGICTVTLPAGSTVGRIVAVANVPNTSNHYANGEHVIKNASGKTIFTFAGTVNAATLARSVICYCTGDNWICIGDTGVVTIAASAYI